MNSSKNEIFIAIFLGILVGLISVLAFYFIFKQKGSFTQAPEKISVEVQKTNKPVAEAFEVTVDPSESEIITQTPDFKISGKTDKNADVIIQTNDSSALAKLNSDGSFSHTVTLANGINQIFISAILKDQEKTIEKTIYYEKK